MRLERIGDMTCDEARQLLPFLLNASLNAAERDRLAAHLEDCAACRRELADTQAMGEAWAAHPPPDRLTAWAFGDALAADERSAIERHVALCASCREEADLARLSASLPPWARATGADRADAIVAFPPRRRRATFVAALAASVLLAAIAGWGWWSAREALAKERSARRDLEHSSSALAERHREAGAAFGREREELARRLGSLEAPVAGVVILDLQPLGTVLRGAPSGEPAATLTDRQRASLLVLSTDNVTAYDGYRIRILGERGDTIWEGRDATRRPDGSVALYLPPGTLPAGRIRLTLEGSRGASWREIEAYDLRILDGANSGAVTPR